MGMPSKLMVTGGNVDRAPLALYFIDTHDHVIGGVRNTGLAICLHGQ